jgi:hypothetical protein
MAKKEKKESTQLLELVSKYELCNDKSRPYIIDENRAILIGGKDSKDFLSFIFFEEIGRTPSDTAMKEALQTLRGLAQFRSTERQIFNRVAAVDGKCYLDLCDKKNTIIETDCKGSRIAKNPPVIFARTEGMKSLPIPEFPGTLEKLKSFFNIKREYDFQLLIAWMESCLRGRPKNRGSYAMMNISGSAGSAKSTTAKIIIFLIDPASPEVRTTPKEVRDLFIAASKRNIVSVDNISSLDREMQDCCCSIATGGGFARKENYSDMDETIFENCNPLVFNGIEFSRRPDFTDRCIDIELDEIKPEHRLTEEELWEKVEEARPQILGGLLTLLSKSLREYEKGIKLESLPRLADFAKFTVAVERAAGWTPGSTLKALSDNQQAAKSEISDGTPAIKDIVEYITDHKTFTGTASEFYGLIKTDTKDFPKNPRALSSIIQRNITVLNALGITVEKTRTTHGRIFTLMTQDANDAKFPTSLFREKEGSNTIEVAQNLRHSDNCDNNKIPDWDDLSPVN